MGVNVDETGGDDLAFRIDDVVRAVAKVFFDSRDPFVPDCNIRHPRRRESRTNADPHWIPVLTGTTRRKIALAGATH